MRHRIFLKSGLPWDTSKLLFMYDALMEIKKNKKKKDGIRTSSLLRTTSANYIRLIGDADRKARIMLIVNSILLTISITLLTKSLNDVPNVWISAAFLIIANIFTLLFSVLSVKPELHRHIAKETEDNILHYKKCIDYNLQDYTALVLDTIHDNDKKMEAVIKDIYYFGNLLNTKYKLINIAYRIFFWGVVVSVTSYFFILSFINR